MLNNSESDIQSATGSFSTIPQLFNGSNGARDSYSGVFKLPGQCRVFLGSNYEFIWFIEQWDVTEGLLSNKKTYPAKVTGINLPYLFNETVTWRDGLIQSSANTTLAFRPGFGQAILSDLSRPFKSVAMQQNHLGLNIPLSSGSFYLCGTLGRLMAMAATVDETLGKAYDASQSEKKKSLNSQDYEQIPTYPAYDISIYNSGY